MNDPLDFLASASELPKPEWESTPAPDPEQVEKLAAGVDDAESVSDPREEGIVFGVTPLIDIVRKFAKPDDPFKGIPLFPPETWGRLSEHYRQVDIQRAFAKHIVEEKVPYPRPFPTRDDARRSFGKLFHVSSDLILVGYDPEVQSYETKESYKHWSDDRILGSLLPEVIYRASSGHWHDENRLRCPGWEKGSLAVWEDEKALGRIRWPFWSMTDGPCDMAAWRKGVSVAPHLYVASQFSPATAKAVYEWLGAEVTLDPSCGWGDRLAGFYASSCTKVYCGCDPAVGSFRLYKDQCRAYERWLDGLTGGGGALKFQEFEIAGYRAFSSKGHKHVFIVNGPFEDIPWEGIRDKLTDGFDLVFTDPKRFDLVFTSPPYFGLELYSRGESGEHLQTWSRYSDFPRWLDEFFYPLLDRCYGLLREGGYMGINIADTVLRRVGEEAKHYKIADPMVDHMIHRGAHYCGALAMVLRKRPSDSQRMKELTLVNYAEPIWVFQRGGDGATAPIHGEVTAASVLGEEL